jgi:Putative Zn-dependent protease, contains TPR repeats
MKAIKYVLMGALMLGAVAPAMAQLDNKTIIEQGTSIIKAKGADYANQVKQLYKDNKKNPEVLVALGKAFLNAQDTANASKFADYALQRNGKYAPAFLLKGDIAVAQDDAGAAAENYQQAKYFDPKDPDAYYKYAMILRGRSPEEAVQNLEELRVQRPDYPVDQLCGRIYYIAQKYEKAESYYAKVTDLSKMSEEDITYYAMTEWLLGKRDKSIEICKAGLSRDPRRSGWNRIAFYNYTDLKDADNALLYADRLFNKSDSAHFIAEDYVYYGTALQQAKKWDEAIAALNQAKELNKDNAKQNSIIDKNLSDVYLEKNDFDNAVAFFEKSIAGKETPSMDDYDNLGTLYTDIAHKKSEAGDAAGSTAALKKADAVYGKMMEAYPKYQNWCNYKRAQINANLDPDSKQGLAKPYYEALASSLEAKEDRSANDNAMLGQSYFYLMVYAYNVKQDKTTAKLFAGKLLQIDPTNEVAKQVQSL